VTNISILERSFKAALIWALALALLFGAIADDLADEVYGESGVTYEEGHPTAYGGVKGWNPLKSLEIAGKMALEYIEELLKN
jgi:hypothetical protein